MISAEVAEVIDWMGILVLGTAVTVPLLLLGCGLAGIVLTAVRRKAPVPLHPTVAQERLPAGAATALGDSEVG